MARTSDNLPPGVETYMIPGNRPEDEDDIEHDSDCRPCGCPLDYHLSDCPILTDRYA